jgi:hypothetical protein
MRVPNVMEVSPTLPVKTVPEFIAYAKANPGKVMFASSGVGTTYLGPRLGYFVIRLLNLSLLKKCDPRIWIVVSLELIGIFQGDGIVVSLIKQKLGSV